MIGSLLRTNTARLAAILFVAALAQLPVAAQDSLQIPQGLREGWGFAEDIHELGESLDGGYELTERDVDCDGQPEVLLEWLALRGATGKRGYLLFDHRPGGYRYLGQTSSVWAVLDYGSSGGCYLATYSKSGAGRMVVHLASSRPGVLEPLGSLELLMGDAGTAEDNALLSALGTANLEEERLRQFFAVADLRPIEMDTPAPLPWVERSSIEEVIEVVKGYGPQAFERLRPEGVGAAGRSPLWGRVSPRVARRWAATVEEAIVDGYDGDDRPHWLPPAGSGGIEIIASRVEEALRLSLPLGRPPAGVAIGRFGAELRWPASEPVRHVEITWTAVIATTRLGDPQGLLRLFLGAVSDGESRRIFRLERITNLDHDPEQEVVIDEEAYAGRVHWLLDLVRGEGLAVRRLHVDAWD